MSDSTSRHETAIGTALRRAGYHTTKERLYNAATDALNQSGNSKPRAMAILLAKLREDVELLWAFSEPYRDHAAMKLLNEVIADTAPPDRGRPASVDAPRPSAARPQADLVAAHVEMVRQSVLDTLLFRQQAIGDWCPRQLRSVPTQKRVEARIIELLMAGVPDDMRLRDAHSPERADAFARQAQQEIQG